MWSASPSFLLLGYLLLIIQLHCFACVDDICIKRNCKVTIKGDRFAGSYLPLGWTPSMKTTFIWNLILSSAPYVFFVILSFSASLFCFLYRSAFGVPPPRSPQISTKLLLFLNIYFPSFSLPLTFYLLAYRFLSLLAIFPNPTLYFRKLQRFITFSFTVNEEEFSLWRCLPITSHPSPSPATIHQRK